MKYPNWTGDEPCRQAPELFWPETRAELDDARPMLTNVCRVCPMVDECREWAIRHEEHGWWGGMSPGDRNHVRRELGVLLEPVDYYGWIPKIAAGASKKAGAA